MLKVVRSRKKVIALVAGLAILGFACSGSSGPTSPVATQSEPELLSTSSNFVGDAPATDVYVRTFWATAYGEPELMVNGDKQYIRLKVGCRHSPEGPDTLAVFRFYGKTMKDGAKLWPGAEFRASVRPDGKDGRDWAPAYRVLDCSMPDAR